MDESAVAKTLDRMNDGFAIAGAVVLLVSLVRLAREPATADH